MAMGAARPEHVEAIVVGSGFGGAVLAARLAQAGVGVAVLERGRRWSPGSFPRTPDLTGGWLWSIGAGLYDIRWLDKLISVQGAGWGGGSLVYANVFARPFDPSLSDRWPPHLRRDQLDPYYDLAAHMLDVRPVGVDPATGRVPARTALVESVVQRMDRAAGTIRPNLAVRFAADPDAVTSNRHGVVQAGCDFVGDCVIGCNRGAKNSLDHNYLAVAERAGAIAVTHAEVVRVEPDDSGYTVTRRDPSDAAAPLSTMTSSYVFLAAGAVGTTELLLRQRDVLGTLPLLSSRLGEEFSGNGDFLMTTTLRSDADLTRGPTITTTTVLDVPEGRAPVWFQVQDGGIPLPLQRLVHTSLPLKRLRVRWSRRRGSRSTHRMALLSMGRDSASGHLTLNGSGNAVVAWDNRREARLYRAESRVGPLLSGMLRTRVHPAPSWTFLRRAVTVHNLGGVPADRPGVPGVVDQWGQVHGYPGLFVVDGSTVPGSTGVNPSATILAAAERAAEHIARQLTGDPQWRAPEWPEVEPAPVPEDAASREMAHFHARTSGNGIRFRERMATPRARRTREPVADLQLTVSFRGFDDFLRDDHHTLDVTGTVTIHSIATRRPARGSLSLFPRNAEYAMRYMIEFDDDRNAPWQLTGRPGSRACARPLSRPAAPRAGTVCGSRGR
jgi:cholesterol oxidase